MKKNKKILYLLIAFGIILILVGVGCLLFARDEKVPVVDNDDQQQDKPIVDESNEGDIYFSPETKVNNNIEVSNFRYTKQERGYLLSFDISNKSNIKYDNLKLMFVLYKGDQELLYSFDFHGGRFNIGETKSFQETFYFTAEEMTDYNFAVIN